MAHTKEPWRVGRGGMTVMDSTTSPDQPSGFHQLVATGSGKPKEESIANMRRIVACVNALAGCTTELLENAKPEEIARRLVVHDELLGCLVDLLEKAEQVDEELTGPADKEFFSPSLLAKCRQAIARATGTA